MTSHALDEFADRILAIERQVRALGKPRLAYASVDDGAIQFFDSTFSGTLDPETTDGSSQTAAIIGRQYDGTTTAASVSGPVPPTPSTPVVTPATTGIQVTWDGLFVDPLAVAPMDFTRIEVHVSTDPSFVADTTVTLYQSIETPRGATVLVGLESYDVVYVRLVTRTEAGKRSPQSVATSCIPGGTIDVATGAPYFRGGIIEGGIIRTAQDGSRVELADDGTLVSYSSSGIPIFQIYSSDDDTVSGAIGARFGKGAGLEFDGEVSKGVIYKDPPTFGRRFWLKASGTISDGAAIAMMDNGATGNSGADDGAINFLTSGITRAVVLRNGDLRLYQGLNFFETDNSRSAIAGTTAAPRTNTRTARLVGIDDSNGDEILAVDTVHRLRNWGTYNATTTAAANMVVVSNGAFARSTSLRAAKADVEYLELEQVLGVLELAPTTWRDRVEVDTDPAQARRYAGFIAEDVAAVAEEDPAVRALLTLDDDGQLVGLQYERVVALLVPVVRELAMRAGLI